MKVSESSIFHQLVYAHQPFIKDFCIYLETLGKVYLILGK